MLEQEPPEPDDPILKLDNVILAPHALCWTDQCFAGNGAADVRAVLDVQHGRVPRGVVNRAVLDSPVWRERLAALAPPVRTLKHQAAETAGTGRPTRDGQQGGTQDGRS